MLYFITSWVDIPHCSNVLGQKGVFEWARWQTLLTGTNSFFCKMEVRMGLKPDLLLLFSTLSIISDIFYDFPSSLLTRRWWHVHGGNEVQLIILHSQVSTYVCTVHMHLHMTTEPLGTLDTLTCIECYHQKSKWKCCPRASRQRVWTTFSQSYVKINQILRGVILKRKSESIYNTQKLYLFYNIMHQSSL